MSECEQYFPPYCMSAQSRHKYLLSGQGLQGCNEPVLQRRLARVVAYTVEKCDNRLLSIDMLYLSKTCFTALKLLKL